MLASAVAITLTGPGTLDTVLAVMREAFMAPASVIAGDRSLEAALMRAIIDALLGLVPFFVIVVIAGVLVFQQPSPPAAGVNLAASIPPTVSAMRLAGMTTDIGGLSRLTASDLRLPTREVTTAIPSMPRMPRVPNS